MRQNSVSARMRAPSGGGISPVSMGLRDEQHWASLTAGGCHCVVGRFGVAGEYDHQACLARGEGLFLQCVEFHAHDLAFFDVLLQVIGDASFGAVDDQRRLDDVEFLEYLPAGKRLAGDFVRRDEDTSVVVACWCTYVVAPSFMVCRSWRRRRC